MPIEPVQWLGSGPSPRWSEIHFEADVLRHKLPAARKRRMNGREPTLMSDQPTDAEMIGPTLPPGAVKARRRGPAPNTVRRYEADNCKLFPVIQELTRDGRESVSGAALKLANEGRVSGIGAPQSRAKRLAAAYRRATTAEQPN
jgi:hypothetical protein